MKPTFRRIHPSDCKCDRCKLTEQARRIEDLKAKIAEAERLAHKPRVIPTGPHYKTPCGAYFDKSKDGKVSSKLKWRIREHEESCENCKGLVPDGVTRARLRMEGLR